MLVAFLRVFFKVKTLRIRMNSKMLAIQRGAILPALRRSFIVVHVNCLAKEGFHSCHTEFQEQRRRSRKSVSPTATKGVFVR